MLCEYLRSHEDELAEVSAKECFHRLNCVLAERGWEVYPSLYEGAPSADRLAEYPRACVILFNSVVGEVWSYGDCQCRIGEELHCEEKEVEAIITLRLTVDSLSFHLYLVGFSALSIKSILRIRMV